jgi:hypothetical protein
MTYLLAAQETNERLGSLGTLGGLAYEQVQEQMVVDY